MNAPAPPGKLAGKACVITGATSGIGLATARLFRAHGARLAIMARDGQAVTTTAAELAPDVVTVTGDVARVADLAALMRAAGDAYDGIDVVVANAGIGRFAPLDAVTEDEFDALCAIHLRGAFFTVQTALPYLRPGGAVVLVSSTGAQRGFPMTSVYNAVKAGVRSLGRRARPARHPRQYRQPRPHRHSHGGRRPGYPGRAARRGRPPAARPDSATPSRPPRRDRRDRPVPRQRGRELLHRRRPHPRRRYP
jgi:NADP-dependent 3-hydroxy acid dehydrogenase YdfG